MKASEVQEAAGITHRQLDHWCARGLVVATQPGQGTGYPREFTEHEAQVLVLMAALVRAGVHPPQAVAYARALLGAGAVSLGRGVWLEYEQEAYL
jgi:DNA-binding transcriptional MerR regulator